MTMSRCRVTGDGAAQVPRGVAGGRFFRQQISCWQNGSAWGPTARPGDRCVCLAPRRLGAGLLCALICSSSAASAAPVTSSPPDSPAREVAIY